MDRREIIKKFLASGCQLDFASLEFFFKNQDKIDQFFQKRENKQLPKIITLNFLQSFLKEPNIEILKTFSCEKRRISIQDAVRYFAANYEKLKSMLIGSQDLINLISINKISNQTKNFSLIGMVREKDEESNSITIEDTTGDLEIFIDGADAFHEIVIDDVLGAVCTKNDKIFAERIIWPEIPLRRSINRTDEDAYCLFISDFHMDAENFNKKAYEIFLEWLNKTKYDKFYLFILGDISSKKEDIVNFFNNLPTGSFKIFAPGEIDPDINIIDALLIKHPTILKIEDKLIFLICHGDALSKYTDIWKKAAPNKVMLNLLKKRQLDPVFDKQIYKEDQILDAVPDVFVSGHFHEPSLLNYKGTTILTTGGFTSTPTFWLMNLKTRETIKIDFA